MPTNLESTADDSNVYAQEVLTIQDLSPTDPTTIPNMTTLSDSITDVAVEARDHNIHDFLARPRVVAQGTIPAGGATNDTLFTLHFPNDLLSLETIREKLKGFLFLRSDIRINIIFTAAPTTSGAFRALIAPDLDIEFLNSRTRNSTASSQFPNHIINVADLPNLQHTVPWISQYTHRNLGNNSGNAGYYRLTRLTPTSAPVGYIVYASFDTKNSNFSLTQATPMNPFYAPLTVTQRNFDLIKSFAALSSAEIKELNKKYPTLKLQAQIKNVKTESSATNFGLSNIASATGSIASTLSGIPVIGSIASTVAPIANLAANLFSAFGFSRPNNEQPTKPLKQHPLHDNVTCDGTHSSHTFAVQNLNTVKTVSGTYGSETDDLALARLYRHPNYIRQFTVSTSSAYREVLVAMPMDGFEGRGWNIPQTGGDLSIVNDITLTHQSFCLQLFKYWLAKIVLNVHIFATQFHSVKLRFIIAPGHYSTTLPSNIDDSNSIVVNFGKNSYHQIKFPEVSNRQFLMNRHSNDFYPPFTPSPGNADTMLGYLFIVVEVPLLTMNDTVSPTVYGVIEHFFEDARFMTPLNYPIAPQLVQLPAVKQEKPKPDKQTTTAPKPPPLIQLPAIKQEKSEPDKQPTIAPKIWQAQIESVYANATHTDTTTNAVTAHNADAPKHNFTAYEQSAGEAIVSLRQFATQFTEPLFAQVDNDIPATAPQITYDPFRTYYFDATAPENTQTDKLDYILSPFAFHKGSRHVRVYFPSGSAATRSYFSAVIENTYNTSSRIVVRQPTTTNPHIQTQRVVPVATSLEGVADFHIPYYQPYHMVRNQPANSTLLTNNLSNPNNLVFRATPGTPYYLSRAAGDDFSAGYLCGLPPYTITATNVSLLPPTLP